jgi:hypothetical protein
VNTKSKKWIKKSVKKSFFDKKKVHFLFIVKLYFKKNILMENYMIKIFFFNKNDLHCKNNLIDIILL